MMAYHLAKCANYRSAKPYSVYCRKISLPASGLSELSSMAASNVTQLHRLPWPVWVGVSVALHIGVLSIGLPHMVQINESTEDSSVNIPVTLVDEDSSPAAAPTYQAQPVPPQQPVPQSNPIGGQNTAIAPAEQAPTQPAVSPAPPAAKVPTQDSPKPENTPVIPPETVPENRPSPQDEPSDSGETAAETGDNSQENSAPTQVSIVDDIQLPKEGGGDQIDKYPTPMFQNSFTLAIPNGHGCQGTLSTNVIDLGVLIDASGLVSSFSLLQPTIYDQSPDLKMADCLLSAALQADPGAIQFSPALRVSNIGEEEAVATDRVQLRLRFDGG